MRSPFWFVIAPAVALAAAGVRWGLQGSGNLYTATSKRFYVADPDLGYRVAAETPVWIGLDALGVLAGVVVGVLGAAWFIRRRERRHRPWRLARWLVGVGAAATLALPVAVFASGGGPAGGLEALPQGQVAAPPTAGIEGRLAAPRGRYQVLDHAGTAITARVSAGHEVFDARITGVTGFWEGDPGDLTQPLRAEASAPAATVDTGNPIRSNHARDEYLYAGEHPNLTFALGRLVAARQDGPDVIVFRAEATLGLRGRDHPVEITGTLRAADAAARARLGTTGPTLVAHADAVLVIADSALAPDAVSFDAPTIPLHVSMVLVHQPT